MLAKLVESGPRRPSGRRTLPGAMLSLALHGGAILSLIHATGSGDPPLPPILLDSNIVFPVPVRSANADRETARPIGGLPDLEPGPPVPDLDFPVSIPDGILPVDLTGPVPRAPRRPTSSLPGSIFDGSAAGEPGGPFTAPRVDEPPVRLFSPPIEYPAILAQAGVEGVVMIEAVVDTVGNVEPRSVRLISADHPGLVASARRVVERSRFRPGRVRGRPVRVVVRLPVVFRLD